MFKKLLSCAAAFVLAFGGAQALPYNILSYDMVYAFSQGYENEDFIYEVYDDGTLYIVDFKGTHSKLIVPGSIDGITVTGFNTCINREDDALTELIVSEGVKEISQQSFENCHNLKSVSLPSSIVSIGSSAFEGCTNLESINIPENVSSIGISAFKDTKWLEKKKSESSPVIINDILIDGTNCVEKVIIPNNVKEIGGGSFENCETLKSIILPNSVKTISSYAFFGCSNLADISIPYSVSEIGFAVFKNCDNLTIKCYSGSTVEKYAKDNNIKYELLDAPKTVDLKTCTATLSKSSYTYTGSANKPTVTVKNGSTTLKSGTDYTVAYKNNTNAGTATVTITGKGSYTGTITKTFKITAASIAKSTVTGIANKYYTGKAITQSPTVKLGNKTLKKGTDYTVTFKNNKAVGKATVTIKGKGNYSGTVTKTFKILPKKTTLKTAASPKKGQLKVTYSKQTNITGYQITYSTDKSFKSKASKASAKTSKTISGLKSGKTYYVKVRTYKTVNGTKYYSGYSAVKKIKVK